MKDLKSLMMTVPVRTLAVAESLTCGRLQARIGKISGASGFFLGGITAYSIEEKVRHLGVRRRDAQPVNSVSRRVAEQMARGACRLFGSDIGIGTTGYAEPSPEHRVRSPYAWWSVARRVSRTRFEFRSGRVNLTGNRGRAQEQAARTALDALLAWLREPAAGRRK
jgi:nicotinamide-nucleotide amidase